MSALTALISLILIVVSSAEARQARQARRIGILWGGMPVLQFQEAFAQGLQKFGYVVGKNVIVEHRYGKGSSSLLPALAAELVELKPEAIVASGTPAALAVKNTTKTIPIVFVNVGDPVNSGLVGSLALPGGNATGLSLRAPELTAKRLELLTAYLRGASNIAVLMNSTNDSHKHNVKELRPVAKALKVDLQFVEVERPDEFDRAFDEMSRGRVNALMVLPDAMFFSQRGRIAQLAVDNRLPAMYSHRGYVEAGGLMAYGPNEVNFYERAAIYIDRILRGAKPAELPVEQPLRLEFIVNLRAAREIGLMLSPEVLQHASELLR
jgi:putative ABC transport system substrate-binding protein